MAFNAGLLSALALIGLVAMAPAPASELRLPEGSSIMVDGRIGQGEWADASYMMLEGGATLMAKRRSDDLLLGVRLPVGAYRYLDVYVRDSDGRSINLHASMRQGERVLPKEWTDSSPAFAWGPLKDWQSSIARRTTAPPDAPISRQLEPIEGYEMRVPVAHLGCPPFSVRVEIRDFIGEAPDWVYPAASSRSDHSTWLRIAR